MAFFFFFFCLFPDKEYWLKMPIEKKRGFYKCKSRYLTLDKIETWDVTRRRVGELPLGYKKLS